MSFFIALSFIIGVVSGLLAIHEFLEKRNVPATVYGAVAGGMIVLAILVSVISSAPGSVVPGSNLLSTPSITSSTQQGTTLTPVQTVPSPISSTPLPSGTIVCDTTQPGQGWDSWNLNPGWKILNGVLLYDGTGNGGRLQAPNFCQPPSANPNYRVIVRMQIVNACCHFGIILRGSASSNGYTGYQVYINRTTFHNANIGVNGGSGGGVTVGYDFSDSNFHLYSGEVNNNVITFLIDSASVLSLTDNSFLQAGEVSICCTDTMQLAITSFKVITI